MDGICRAVLPHVTELRHENLALVLVQLFPLVHAQVPWFVQEYYSVKGSKISDTHFGFVTCGELGTWKNLPWVLSVAPSPQKISGTHVFP